MENENYQKELFEFDPPKKTAAKFGNIFQRTDFVIVLTPEKMVFAAIGIIMLMVIFFALGVEKGKATVYPAAATPRMALKNIAVSPVIPERKAVVTATNITPKISPPPAPKMAQAALDKSKPYTIVAAAFSREDFALKEAGKLKAIGLEAFVYYGGSYYLACIGSFQDKVSAQKILNKIKRMHKDAYIRLK